MLAAGFPGMLDCTVYLRGRMPLCVCKWCVCVCACVRVRVRVCAACVIVSVSARAHTHGMSMHGFTYDRLRQGHAASRAARGGGPEGPGPARQSPRSAGVRHRCRKPPAGVASADVPTS